MYICNLNNNKIYYYLIYNKKCKVGKFLDGGYDNIGKCVDSCDGYKY